MVKAWRAPRDTDEWRDMSERGEATHVTLVVDGRHLGLERITPGYAVFRAVSSRSDATYQTIVTRDRSGVSARCTCPGALYRRKCWHMETARKVVGVFGFRAVDASV